MFVQVPILNAQNNVFVQKTYALDLLHKCIRKNPRDPKQNAKRKLRYPKGRIVNTESFGIIMFVITQYASSFTRGKLRKNSQQKKPNLFLKKGLAFFVYFLELM